MRSPKSEWRGLSSSSSIVTCRETDKAVKVAPLIVDVSAKLWEIKTCSNESEITGLSI